MKIIITQSINYFRHRPGDLLVINLEEPSAFKNFCSFLELDSDDSDFPWINKTDA